MRKVKTKKIGLEMSVDLYGELSKLARENGQSRRYLLEKAVDHYLHQVVPSQAAIGPEAMKQFRRSVDKNRKLYELLAK